MSKALQSLAVLMTLPLIVFWGWFSLSNYPLIVPPDSDSEYVKAYERAAMAGVGLAIVSGATTLLAAKLFGRGLLALGIAALLLFGLMAASIALYPSLESMRLTCLRLPAQIAGAIAIVLGMAGTRSSRAATVQRRLERDGSFVPENAVRCAGCHAFADSDGRLYASPSRRESMWPAP